MALTAAGPGFMWHLWCVENLLGMAGNTLLLRFIIAMIGLISHSRGHLCQSLPVEGLLPAFSAAEDIGTEIRHDDDDARKDDSPTHNPPGFLLC